MNLGPPNTPPTASRYGRREAPIRVGRETTGVLEYAERLEWLVTNGLGGYGSGTVAGSITRGYHGLLVAALRPPVDRRLMLVKLDETVTYRGESYDLATNRWCSGVVAPTGYANIESFELEGSVPVWRFAYADALIEKRIWMKHAANTTYVACTVVSAARAMQLAVRAIVDNRGFHNTGEVARPAQISRVGRGLQAMSGGPGSVPPRLIASAGEVTVSNELYQGYLLPAETSRGLNDRDDHMHAGTFVTCQPGATLLVVATAERDAAVEERALDARRARDEAVLSAWRRTRPPDAPVGSLIGPFVTAHLRAYGDLDAAPRFLTPPGDHVGAAGLGSVSEVFDGDPPLAPQGCIAQAWSVAEMLRSYVAIEEMWSRPHEETVSGTMTPEPHLPPPTR
jgi:glycogen debranching enzyme